MSKVVTMLQRLEQVATDPACPTDQLSDLSQHRSARIRCAVASNTKTSDEVLLQLLADQSDLVRVHAATTSRSRPKLHEAILQSPDKWVRALLVDALIADEHALCHEHQHQLAGDSFKEVRTRLAPRTPYGDVFDILLTDPDPDVRGWCAGNPRISIQQMERLVTDRAWRARAHTALLGLRYPTDKQLMGLACDRSAAVRWEVLARVDTPVEAIKLIAEDNNDINRAHAELILSGRGVNSSLIVAQTRRSRAEAVYAAFE